MVLTRKHYSRLRWYWQGRDNGSPVQCDGVDLDLINCALIERRERVGGGKPYYVITDQGEAELVAEKGRESLRREPHHEMSARVAAWLREQGRVTWENIELMVDKETGGRQAVRPDVFSLVATYNAERFNPCVHEVKVSRSDFFADVKKPEKRAGYVKLSEVFFYVVPDGLVTLNEVPEGCGLIVELSEGKFDIVHKPRKRKVELTPHHFMNLILKQGTVNPLL